MGKDLIAVECLEPWRLRLTFEGGEQREVDITSLTPFRGVFEPLKDPDYFRQVRVLAELGTISWPSGADLCPDVLYENSRPVPTAAADAPRATS